MEVKNPPEMLKWTIWEILNKHFLRYTTKKDNFKIFKPFDDFSGRGNNARHWGIVIDDLIDVCRYLFVTTSERREYQKIDVQKKRWRTLNGGCKCNLDNNNSDEYVDLKAIFVMDKDKFDKPDAIYSRIYGWICTKHLRTAFEEYQSEISGILDKRNLSQNDRR